MDFSDVTLYKLGLLITVISIAIGVFAGWSFSDTITKKFKKKKNNYWTIAFLKLEIALFGGLLLTIITHYLLDILRI